MSTGHIRLLISLSLFREMYGCRRSYDVYDMTGGRTDTRGQKPDDACHTSPGTGCQNVLKVIRFLGLHKENLPWLPWFYVSVRIRASV